MSVRTEQFGDSPAKIVRITNSGGSALTLTDLGATIVGIEVPSRTGALTDVVLGYGSYDDYMAGDKYFGASIGRYANRIAHGELTIGGRGYLLDRNQDGRHTLHGGADGWHRRVWATDASDGEDAVTFALHSPDLDQGFPGNADVTVRYRLTDDNIVRISYRAVSDQDTVFNLTNHAYFNLSGEGEGDILGHRLRLNADQLTEIDSDAIPSGRLMDVRGTALDFTEGKPIGRDIGAGEEQIANAGGFDHNYVIRGTGKDSRPPEALRLAAEAYSEETGISMTVRTDMPGVQFYSGNYLGDDRPAKSGGIYPQRGGFCLETQFFPDSPHQNHFPSAVYRAGEVFESTTEYAFSVVR
ncbi:MAG: galactose mutarotase [Clostridiales Family XIII bacterium]|jgi:aldose 1-epimerase|nr:galactose mutarotase [Clostridiales Family XIII bacterium]